MNRLYVIVNQGSATRYLFKNIERDMNVVVIPDKLGAPKNLFLKISRFLLVGKFPLPVAVLGIWFDKAFLRSLTAVKPSDRLLIFENINFRALGMIKHLVPRETTKYNWFGNPIHALFKGKDPRRHLEKIKRTGYEIATFDRTDAQKYRLTFHTPFIRFPLEKEKAEGRAEFDFFFCGKPKDREAYLLRLKSRLETSGYSCKFIIPHTEDEYIAYEEMLEYVKKSRCIIDIYQKGQSGLTRRPLEALFYNKKLLINNPRIVEYDFYHPDNVFILSDRNEKEIPAFLRKAPHPVSRAVKEKYDIHEWLRKFLPE